jgi:hypothetical protein
MVSASFRNEVPHWWTPEMFINKTRDKEGVTFISINSPCRKPSFLLASWLTWKQADLFYRMTGRVPALKKLSHADLNQHTMHLAMKWLSLYPSLLREPPRLPRSLLNPRFLMGTFPWSHCFYPHSLSTVPNSWTWTFPAHITLILVYWCHTMWLSIGHLWPP